MQHADDNVKYINGLPVLPVEIVVSSPRLHPWLLKIPGSQILSSINTTHWGVKVDQSYHDLKKLGLYRTKPGVAYAASLAERDERPISRVIPIGHTHFEAEEVRNFVKHRIAHAPWYNFWFENCQHYAIQQMARHILCSNCHTSDSDIEKEITHRHLAQLQVARITDNFVFIAGFAEVLLDYYSNMKFGYHWWGPHITEVQVLRFAIRRYVFLVSLDRIGARNEETIENSLLSREFDLGQGERKDESRSSSKTVKNSTENKAVIPYSWFVSKDSDYWRLLFLSGFLPLVIHGDKIILDLGFVVVMVASGSFTVIDYVISNLGSSRFGRDPVSGPCEQCSSWLKVSRTRAYRCNQIRRRFPNVITHTLPQRQLDLSTGTKSQEDITYLILRVCSAVLLVYLGRNFSFQEQAHLHFGLQVTLNYTSPVTPHGLRMRRMVAKLWGGYIAFGTLLWKLYGSYHHKW